MGGRMIIQLAAVAPERVLAAVLLNAAAGSPFDQSIRPPVRSPRRVARAMLNAAYDAPGDPRRLPGRDRNRYVRQMTAALARNVRTPLGLPGAVRAIVTSGDYTPMLDAMREHHVPTIVVHGERDLVVPFENARDMADHADATLYRVPGAYHSWMLAHPRQGADMMRQLLAAELGEVLCDAAREHGAGDAVWWDELLTADSSLRRLGEEPVDADPGEVFAPVDMDRLRSAHRVPRDTSCERRRRWWSTWRRNRRVRSSARSADIA